MCWEETFAGSLGPLVGTDCSPSSSTTGATSRTYTAASTLVHRSETVTDATGKARTLYYDVLGRLSGVMEDPTGLKYFTAYEYDLNNNLTTAKQFGECTATSDPMSNYGACTAQIVRSFAYSSLNRLTNATNPESGSIDYQYDNNGNVIRRAHGGVVRCAADSAAGGTCSGASGYDDLNRLVKQTYSDGTPTVVYGYDGVIGGMSPQCLTALSGEPPRTSAPIGRLTYVQAKNASTGANVSATSYFYTPLGHSLCQRQTTDRE